ncbi:hypothetical protein L9F63_027054, partial [Diploptera punctata]
VAKKGKENDNLITAQNNPGVDVKNDPEDIEIKDELMEFPLDVTLEADGDAHIEPKSNSTDDEDDNDEQNTR